MSQEQMGTPVLVSSQELSLGGQEAPIASELVGIFAFVVTRAMYWQLCYSKYNIRFGISRNRPYIGGHLAFYFKLNS